MFEELNRRKATVYFHPVTPVCCRNLLPGVLDPILEVPEDTARAVVSLLVNGTLARMRNITWLFSHAGGTLPALAGRINSFFAGDHPAANLAEWAPHGIMAELGKLNFDIADSAWPGSIAALRQLVPMSHVTFGSDFPYFRSTQTVEAMRTLPLTPEERRAIDYDNARRILPRLTA